MVFKDRARTWGTMVLRLAGAATVVLTAGRTSAVSQPLERSVWDGVYTEAQARRGEATYKASCSYCHKNDLTGGFEDTFGRAPALAGARAFDSSFMERWGDATMAEMVGAIAAVMPQDRPRSLSVEAYVDIVSFLLEKNGLPAGSQELPATVAGLNGIVIRPK